MQITSQQIKIARQLVSLAVTGSTGSTLRKIIKNNVVTETKIQKVMVTVAAYAMSGIVVDEVENRTIKRFNDVFASTIKRLDKEAESTEQAEVVTTEDAPEKEPESPLEKELKHWDQDPQPPAEA